MARATIAERRLGARRHLLEFPGGYWHYFPLSEVALEFQLKPVQHVVGVVHELAKDGYVEVGNHPVLNSKYYEDTCIDLRVTPRGKKFLRMVPKDAVRSTSEVLDGRWPRKPSKYHHIPKFVDLSN